MYKRYATYGGLVLKRSPGESVFINQGQIIIEVIKVKGKEVSLAFKAAEDVVIDRYERLFPEAKAQKIAANAALIKRKVPQK